MWDLFYSDAYTKGVYLGEDTEDKSVVEFDVPGIPKENITISVENQVLTVEGKTETRSKKFKVALRSKYDLDSIKASLDNGVLYVTIPKSSVTRKIEIL